MKRIAIFILLNVMLIACNKETTKTPGQITADEINSVAKQHSITKVVIYEPVSTGYQGYGSPVSFTLNGQYLIIDGTIYYNLEKLQFFVVSTAPLQGQQCGCFGALFSIGSYHFSFSRRAT